MSAEHVRHQTDNMLHINNMFNFSGSELLGKLWKNKGKVATTAAIIAGGAVIAHNAQQNTEQGGEAVPTPLTAVGPDMTGQAAVTSNAEGIFITPAASGIPEANEVDAQPATSAAPTETTEPAGEAPQDVPTQKPEGFAKVGGAQFVIPEEKAEIEKGNLFLKPAEVPVEKQTAPEQQTYTVRPLANGTNVRTGPGTNFAIDHKVGTADTLTVQDSVDPNWYKVISEDGIIVVGEKYIEIHTVSIEQVNPTPPPGGDETVVPTAAPEMTPEMNATAAAAVTAVEANGAAVDHAEWVNTQEALFGIAKVPPVQIVFTDQFMSILREAGFNAVHVNTDSTPFAPNVAVDVSVNGEQGPVMEHLQLSMAQAVARMAIGHTPTEEEVQDFMKRWEAHQLTQAEIDNCKVTGMNADTHEPEEKHFDPYQPLSLVLYGHPENPITHERVDDLNFDWEKVGFTHDDLMTRGFTVGAQGQGIVQVYINETLISEWNGKYPLDIIVPRDVNMAFSVAVESLPLNASPNDSEFGIDQATTLQLYGGRRADWMASLDTVAAYQNGTLETGILDPLFETVSPNEASKYSLILSH
ncbi:MAG TPA: hypothetical protein VLH19_05745 [Patescibacteria group bacterium]|nr:hypothetical protein [Patescibacteria group bacterium]